MINFVRQILATDDECDDAIEIVCFVIDVFIYYSSLNTEVCHEQNIRNVKENSNFENGMLARNWKWVSSDSQL